MVEKCARKPRIYPGFQNRESVSMTFMESLEVFTLNAACGSPGYKEGDFNPKESAEEEGQRNGDPTLGEGTKSSWCCRWILVIM